MSNATAPQKKKVLVAMSGGVDSSLTAAALAAEGFDVVGVTMKLLKRGATGFGCCGSPDDTLIAKRSAEKAGIPHYVLDYAPDFEKDVINYFTDSYVKGETPNPCLACNRFIKFDKLEKFAETIDADFLATGHYARIIRDAQPDGTMIHRLFEAADPTKDQSYVLYATNQKSLSRTLFPVGDRPKSQIRKEAEEFNLPNFGKKDSQEICFVPNRDYRTFVKVQLETKKEKPKTTEPGDIKDHKGGVIGRHSGIAFYTVGQRKGLGITTPVPYYVTRLDPDTNTVHVGPDLSARSGGLEADDLIWIHGAPPSSEFQAKVKIRYKHEKAPAVIQIIDGKMIIRFDTPQRAVSPGQAAVVYLWDDKVGAHEVLGGGTIRRAINP